MSRPPAFIQVMLRADQQDVTGKIIAQRSRRYLSLDTGRIQTATLFVFSEMLPEQDLERFARLGLKDNVLHKVHINELAYDPFYRSYILVARLPGVTDDEGVSAQKTFCDLFDLAYHPAHQIIFTQKLYFIERSLPSDDLRRIAQELLGNPLIDHFEIGSLPCEVRYLPTVQLQTDMAIESVDIFVPEDGLLAISKRRLLALDLIEMNAIQSYYRKQEPRVVRRGLGLPELPTDCEMEIIAQTWSEHCKHKEFNGWISYIDRETGEESKIDSLFRTYIQGATDVIRKRFEEHGNSFLVKVFSDNAGVVRIDRDLLFVWKVETHNSPSALDPYGGAITGILGNNRDPLGTGIGGGRLLFNTNVLCFGRPGFDGELLPGQLHPQRVFQGVREGIEHGGNKSGVPTVNGAIIFDDRYRGKPLVYCGTGSVMPDNYHGRSAWKKEVLPGDIIVMAGGRVGKDGIHGATFSSAEIDRYSPRAAVQIGSPITQKFLSDFLEQACLQGLVRCCTDCGAGGLSSAIGELAQFSGGALVNLEKVPLKYDGLRPWEIFLSESQERMTLVVAPENRKALFHLAGEYEVEVSEIGVFSATGLLDVRYGKLPVARLDLEFLHHGVPRKKMEAVWTAPLCREPDLLLAIDHQDSLLRLLGGLTISSRENVIRQYDHEVKGRTIVKPLMGIRARTPQDAAVMRINFDSYQGVAVSCGIVPRYGDIDAYAMSAGAFDEAVRQILSVGGRLPDPEDANTAWWSVNDNFCVPDSAYHPEHNPDGKYKLAQLVRMCRALYDMATAFNIPLTSGKDSMKNDFKGDGVKISVPPTILYSMAAGIPDVRRTVTSEWKKPGDLVYQLGRTYNELGASEYYHLFNMLGANVPQVRIQDNLRLYRRIMAANRKDWITSCHDLSDGGLGVALAECSFDGLGARLQFPDNHLPPHVWLFSESHGRFTVTIDPAFRTDFDALFGVEACFLGMVTEDPCLIVRDADGETLIECDIETLFEAWQGALPQL